MRTAKIIGIILTTVLLSITAAVFFGLAAAFWGPDVLGGLGDMLYDGDEYQQVTGLFLAPMAFLFPIVWGGIFLVGSVLISGIYWLVYVVVKSSRGNRGTLHPLSAAEKAVERRCMFGVFITTFLFVNGRWFGIGGVIISWVLIALYWMYYSRFKTACFTQEAFDNNDDIGGM